MNATALLIFARTLGFVWRAPGFSHPAVPSTLRAALAVVIALGLLPAAHPVQESGVTLVAAAALDLAIGAAIGMGASMLYDGAYFGGRMLDDYVGIRGSVPNAPVYASSGFGRIWSLVFTAGFFLLGGYQIVIAVLARSFARIPLTAIPPAHAAGTFAVSLATGIVQAALLVAAPAIALVFVAQLALGAMTRVNPRFASFTLSFPIVFGTALVATLICIPLLFGTSAIPWLPAGP